MPIEWNKLLVTLNVLPCRFIIPYCTHYLTYVSSQISRPKRWIAADRQDPMQLNKFLYTYKYVCFLTTIDNVMQIPL